MKKLLAILLVAVMALGVLPFAASAEEATIEPYSAGMENWSEQTQLLIVASLPSLDDAMAATWTITLDDGTTSKTVSLQPSSNYDFGGSAIYRFQVCLGVGANQFVPVPGTPYTVSATATIGGTDYNFTAEEGATWTFPADLEPIVPEAPKAGVINIVPKFGKWENWINSPNNPNGKGEQPGVTQLLVGITDSNGQKIDIDPATTTWKITISAGDESKTIEMDPATKALDYNLYRFETCLGEGENQFIPVNGTDYTVQITVLGEDGAELYKSEAVSGFTCPMDPVVPETPVEPEPPVVDPEDPVDPPVTGDATVMIAVLAVVALFGAAVVTKKVFVK